MNDLLSKIKEFADKHGFAQKVDLENEDGSVELLLLASDILLTLAGPLRSSQSLRDIRAGLIVEEAGEILSALVDKDETKLSDGLADLIYVTVGTALTYDLPLHDVFNEVHASNMTKAVRSADDTTLKNKGDSYQPPDIERIIRDYRTSKE